MKKVHKYNFVYKTTNLKNGMIYIGVHQTDDLNDNYLGSGRRLQRAIKYYKKELFKREILHFFDNIEDMFNKEAEIVNEEFIKRKDTYNIVLGGQRATSGCVIVKDKNGINHCVVKDDPRYLSGELVSVAKGLITVKDKDGKTFSVSINDPKYLSGELVHPSKGSITVKDKDGNHCQISINDPRYLSGELVPLFKGKKHSEKTIKKMKKSHEGKQKGESNSQFGTMWIHNPLTLENKKIKRLDYSIPEGWIKGRKLTKVELNTLIIS